MSKLPTLAPQNMTEAMEFSKMLSVSEMVPKSYQRKPQDILVAVQWGYELGLQPLQALQNIAIINGKPSVYGDAALALVKNDPRCAGVNEKIEGDGDARTAYCKVKRRYGEEIEETVAQFSVADAKRARLWGKQGPWSQYPDRMLQMRARGFAIRDAFPDALKGVITAEEAQDYPSEPKDVTPRSNPLDQLKAPEPAPEPRPAPTPEPEYEPQPAITHGEEPDPEPPIEDAIEVQPEAEPDFSPWQVFNHLGNPYGKEPPHTSQDYVNMLKHLMERYANISMSPEGDTIEPREKMTMLRELRERNQARIDQLGEMKTKEIMDAYKLHLRRLGAEMNDD